MCLELNFASINRVREKREIENGRRRGNKINFTSRSLKVRVFSRSTGQCLNELGPSCIKKKIGIGPSSFRH